MGVITCSAPMNPSANVTYTHKKFKRAQKEACESNDLQQKQQQQQQQQPPLQQQKEVGERNGKTEASTVPVVSRSTSSYLVGSQPVNGFLPLPAQLPANTTTATTTTPNVGSFVQQHPDAEERKRKTSGGSSSGKQIYEYMHYGMGWSKPSVHDKHKRTHTNERPYSCHQCSIAFKTKSNFLKHTRSRAHALRCDGGGGQDGTDATVESGDNPDVEGDEAAQCSAREGTGQQSHPTDLSITHTTTSHIIPQEEPGREKGSLYKPKSKFRIQYQEEGTVQGQSPPMRRQHSAPLPDTITVDSVTSNPSTYQFLPTSHPSSYSHGAHSSPGPHSPIPANLSKPCLPPLDIGATIRKEEGSSSSSQQNSVVTPRKISHLWKNMKSPSPELVGQHITKLIVENQVIVDTHNPLCLRRYKRQPSIGSSSSESDGSGSGKNRRNSLVDSGYKTSKTSTPCPRAVGSGPPQAQQRERNLSYTSEAPMVERQSSYSPSLPPTPILPLAQPTVTPVSASKPSISIPGITTSYSQSPPILTAPSMTMMDPSLMDGARKQCIAEGPSVVRDVHKTRIMPPDDVSLLRQHPCNPEGSVIKNLLLTARENISNAIDHHEGSVRVAGQAVPLSEVVPNLCVCCRTPFRNHEEWEIHMRHGCGQRLAGGRGTPDSMKSRDGGRWVVRAGNGAGAREQDEALDLQKKPDHHHHPHHHHQHHHHQLERERSSSRGSSSGDPPVRRGSQDDPRYRFDSTPVVSRSKSVPEGNLPHNKKRKFSDVEGGQNSSLFLTPVFPGKVHGGCKNEFGMKLSIDEIIKQTKQSNLQLFGGEVQICDGNECKTMRIDPSQQPSPAMDIRIPPQQLGGNISKPEVSVPTSVVVTIAKSGLNSGGTMVQVDSKTSTSSTKTVPSLVNSSLHHEHSGGLPVLSPSVPKAAHSPAIYNTSFSPNFMQYAPNLQLPNLAIPGIPAPDLGSMSFSTYSPRTPSQSSLLHPQTSMTQGLLGSHKQSTSRLTLPPPRPASVTFSSSSKPTSPHPAPQTPLIIHTGSHPMSSTHPPLSEASQHPLVISEKEKDYSKVQHKMPSVGYPALIPVGDEKVPYVPGIPGPYSQANMVNPHSKNLERNSVSSLSHLSQPPPPPPIPYVSPATSISPRPGLVPSPREKSSHLSLARSREAPHSPVRDHSQVPGLLKLHHRTSPKEMTSVRPKASPASNVIPEIKTVTPEIRIHPAVSDSETPEKKQVVAEKPGAVSENKKIDTSQKSETSEPEEFLPPRKRPNFLELKPQPFTPKSSLALIGTTLVSPDTPRPKKSCVQMLLNGSAYTYLGHKVSTKSYFCCIYRQQPMYVPQSTDPKLSMYSNWQIRKPAEDNPLKLSPYQSMSLYESCKYDRAYTIAKPKELNLIQTHSSYWTFKEEKEKTKGKEDDQSKEEVKEVKVEEEKDESPKTSVKEESGPSVKREAEDPNPNPDPRGKGGSQDGDGQERGASTAKRIKIFEGGFKSMEDYTYVRGRGRGRYVCETCGIRCKKPSMLRKHIRTHTDLRPYACVHCSFSFKTKGNLTKHLRSKAHYKRCEEMGIVPVPTVVDDSHLNHRALALQGKLEQEGRSDGMDCDDDDDDEDDDDEEDDDDDDEEDDVMEGGNIQFQDAQGHTSTTSPPPQLPPVQEETRVEVRDEATKDATREGRARGVRSGVLVMHPAISALPTTMSTQPHTSKVVTKVQPQQTTSSGTTGDSPMDLSVKKMAAISLASTVTITTTTTTTTHGGDKLLPLKMSLSVGNPSRPSFLPLMSRSSVPPDLRSPVASLSSPATPSTPIREHAFEILSPVTESSSLLKSIYNTTERASHVSSEKQPHVVLDPTKENGSSSFMLQAYLKERAVLDSTIKRHQYKDSSSETSPDSPRTTTIDQFHSTKSNITPNSRHIPGITNTTTTLSSRKAENTKKETYTQQIKGESEALLAGLRNKGNPSPSLSVSSAPTSTTALTTTTNTTINTNTTNTTTASIFTTTTTTTSISSTTSSSSLPTSSSSLPTTITTTTTTNNNNNSKSSNDSNKSQVTSISNSLATAITTTSRMPTPPANLTVMNNGGMDTKTAFLVPSGVVPSSLNRLGNDDGKCKCSVCHKEFNRHSQLSIHMNIHYMERPYRCEACAISFRTNGHLQKHKRSVSHFNKVNMNMTFGPPSSDNPRPFKCRDCKIAFRIHGHLAKHLRSKMHIMKLECLGKLPFGTYAEMERSGANLNEIDTTDCDNSLESLKVMATRMYEKDPTKLSCWQTQQQQTHRVRTVSSSSTSSDDYPMQDDQDDPSASHATPPNDDDTEGDEDEEIPVGREAGRSGSGSSPGAVSVSGAGPVHSPRPHTHTHTHISPIEVGSGATAGLVACHLCHEKFLDIEHLSGHLYTVHKVSVTYRNS
ncbi:hypothetical protein Pmani_028020 [Petrolisthes manimaculis]|uniref:C2H2-type domain-containing protein n=1 Tax=Petrolisthes manimaculis TaxID=1843537 RepID=A0AAE1TW38_9EUCA|nr:hypothetical protein Pmani_028020 [Petrolisthes manimaculis]